MAWNNCYDPLPVTVDVKMYMSDVEYARGYHEITIMIRFLVSGTWTDD